MNESTKALETAVYVRQLETKLAQMQRSFCQTVLAIVTAMPDDEATGMPIVRIAKFDYERCRGRELATYTDPATGDHVFVSRPLLATPEDACG